MQVGEKVVTTNELTRKFGDVPAVDGVTFEVFSGEVFGYLGHNGAGKTTTVRLLNGVLLPSSGEVTVLGMPPSKDGAEIRRRTGVLTETPALDDRLSGREALHFAGRMFDVPGEDLARRSERLLESFGLAERAGDRVGGTARECGSGSPWPAPWCTSPS